MPGTSYSEIMNIVAHPTDKCGLLLKAMIKEGEELHEQLSGLVEHHDAATLMLVKDRVHDHICNLKDGLHVLEPDLTKEVEAEAEAEELKEEEEEEEKEEEEEEEKAEEGKEADYGATPPQVAMGSEGSTVQYLQEVLGLEKRDGIFGEDTHAAVVAFQEGNELKPDGICGPLTWTKLLPAHPAADTAETAEAAEATHTTE